MATRTVTDFVRTTVYTTGTPTSTTRAHSQSGIIGGANPVDYDPSNPIILFIIQAIIVISFCRILHYPLSKMRQPRVIAEVIAGILLGPSVMGRVPGFTESIFPKASIPNFSLVANIGLVLFLFLVGLEVDLRYVASNWKIALSVGAGGMALPFGFGCALSWGLYHEFRVDDGKQHIDFPVYMLFIGVAMAITAFPVLCRILTELKLLRTPVGIVVLSAGVSNDVIGWVLLALSVALVNSGTGLVALWIVLTCFGYCLFLVFIVRPAFIWLLKKTHSIENGPSQAILSVTLLIVFASAFFTGAIGVHPIFGAFMAGLICPHEGQFSIKVAEKIEDLVNSLFLPLYFALSGLSTNLGLLNSAITWGYVIAVIATAFGSKVIGGTIAARLNKREWRESFAIGVLMSCKGLVELIVLNIGFQANILSQTTFTIFVVMALVTTFATTPIASLLYPVWYQQQLETKARKEGRSGSSPSRTSHDPAGSDSGETRLIRRVLVHFRLDSMPELLALVSLLGKSSDKPAEPLPQYTASDSERGSNDAGSIPADDDTMHVHGVRMLPLDERDSSIMRFTEAERQGEFDPVVNTIKAFGRIHGISVSGEVAASTEPQYASTLTSRAVETASDLLLLPWNAYGPLDDSTTHFAESPATQFTSGVYRDFIFSALSRETCNVGVFVNNGFGGTQKLLISSPLTRRFDPFTARRPRAAPQASGTVSTVRAAHRVFVPFFGSADDRLAVRFAAQLARSPRVTVSIVHFKMQLPSGQAPVKQESMITRITAKTKSKMSWREQPSGPSDESEEDSNNDNNYDRAAVSVTAHTGTGARTRGTQTSDSQQRNAAFLAGMRSSLPYAVAQRVSFEVVSCTEPLSDVIEYAKRELGSRNNKVAHSGDLVLAGRNWHTLPASVEEEAAATSSSSSSSAAAGSPGAHAQSCLGAVGKLVIEYEVDASLLVMQAATPGTL